MSGPEITPSEPDPDDESAEEIVNPEDLPAQIEVTEHDGATRIDIAEDAAVRPGDPGDAGDAAAT